MSSKILLAIKNVALISVLMCVNPVFSQQTRMETAQNIVSLQAQGSVEVQQDLLMVSMNTMRDGADATSVQAQLKAALDAALGEARKVALSGQLDVRTGQFSLFPRHGRDGKISGWQGTTEMIVEGRDFARISQLAGRINTLTVGHVSFGLSREARAKVESEATQQAVERFKAKATEVSKAFGFGGYSIREISVNANDQGFAPRPRMMEMSMARAASADAAVPVEAGRSTVVVSVGGAVQMK